MNDIQLVHGDCLVEMKNISDKSLKDGKRKDIHIW